MQENQTEKRYYALKTIFPRPTFQLDMTPAERSIMLEHVAYWTDKADNGIAVVFGPVLDPKGGYGLAVVGVETEEEVHNLISDDPATKAGLLTIEFNPMRAILPKLKTLD